MSWYTARFTMASLLAITFDRPVAPAVELKPPCWITTWPKLGSALVTPDEHQRSSGVALHSLRREDHAVADARA